VEPGLILHDFARDEMFFGVAQRGPSKKSVMKYAIGELAADDGPQLQLANCQPCKTEKFSNSAGSANGNRTRILALKGTIETTISLIFMRFSVILAPRLHPRLKQGRMYDTTRD